MAATATQPKVEKKIMDEKIAKVREVVKNVSTNDIILALHNFELDIARTIHAFCEGGSEVALGDWERTGGAKKRNQKKKSKGVASANSSQSNQANNNKNTNSGTTTPSVASSLVNCSNVSSATNLEDKTLPLTNGCVPPTAPGVMPTNAFSFGTTNHHKQQQQQQKQQFVHPGESGSAKAGGGDHLSMVNHHRPTHPNENGEQHQRMVADGVSDSFGLVDYQSQLVQNREMLEREVSTAQDAIYQCFKDLRDALAAREQRLMDELAHCQKDGHRYFDVRSATLRALISDSTNAKNKASFVSSLEKFNAKKTDDLEVALTARFLCDNSATSAITAAISQLGSVPAVSTVEPEAIENHHQPLTNGSNKNCGEPSSKTATAVFSAAVHTTQGENVVKRSNSPSSLVSSVGEDSGLGGQISPINNVEKGQPVQVEENGIMLKSDTVSADQLAEIQRQIAESLKAKGIDPSVLAGFGTATTVAARRRPPPAASANKMSMRQRQGEAKTAQN